MNPVQSNPIPQYSELSKLGHIANGGISFVIGLIPIQPCFTLKTFSMVGKGIPPIYRLWAGFGPNAASGAPAEGIGFLSVDLCTKYFTKGQNNPKLTDMQNLIASLMSGCLGAPINASLERGMILQQLRGGGFFAHMRSIFNASGAKGLFKGTFATAGRDALFTSGVFAFNDKAKEYVSPHISDPLIRDIVAGIIAGVPAGFLSTPFDLGKTLMQEDTTEKYPHFRATICSLVKEEGVTAIFKGAVPRSFTIGGLIMITSVAKERVPHYFPSFLRA